MQWCSPLLIRWVPRLPDFPATSTSPRNPSMYEPHLERTSTINDGRPWYSELTRYHWFVLIVAALGWLFDTMDQQLFNLARVPAMKELLRPSAEAEASQQD